MYSLDKDMVKYLLKKAKDTTIYDRIVEGDDSAVDFFGSNVDDAYHGGVDDGEIGMAREILHKLGINYHEATENEL